MADKSYLEWPFFEDHHRAYAPALDKFAAKELVDIAHTVKDESTMDEACKAMVAKLGKAGYLKAATVLDANDSFDVRTLCLSRDTLGRHGGLIDFAFAMQGLGTGPISLFGTPEQRRDYLPPVTAGEKIAAFALSEPDAGSDVSNISTTAKEDGGDFILNGTKTWISNGGIADHYIVFARTGEAPGARGLTAFIVDADTPGFNVAERINVIAPHPLATITFEDCRIPASAQVGERGAGFKVAMGTLDVFRSTVGAAALGLARRALDESVTWVGERKVFGNALGTYQMTQEKIAEMALAIDASALLVYRSAWNKDTHGGRNTRESSMAKLHATEEAQLVIDKAVQLFGGRGVVCGEPVEELYREVRALRIYEGTTEVQKMVIAGQVLGG
ncbi:MAG: acyl-CoA dehydrogenase family protein [Rhodospirillales bacterium]|nr:acyl-CoA dehydrogenase family protein [Rhodospirillales bacterium]